MGARRAAGWPTFMFLPASQHGVAPAAGHDLASLASIPSTPLEYPYRDLEAALNFLLCAGSAGAPQAAHYIYRELHPFVAAVVTRQTPDIDADHKGMAISVTFEQFFDGIGRKKVKARLAEALIATIARRRALDELRKQHALQSKIHAGDHPLDEIASNAASPARHIEYQELLSHIHGVVRCFPRRLQQTAWLLLEWSQGKCTPKQLQELANNVYREKWSIDVATAALRKTRKKLEAKGVRKLLESASSGVR